MIVHRDDLAGVDDGDRVARRAAVLAKRRLEPRGVSDERHLEPRAARSRTHGAQRACDFGRGRAVAAECVNDDPHGRRKPAYSSAAFFATIVWPRYCPQLMQTRCGIRGALQLGQGCTIM
jgi:hypothetical protein